jgi:hypothetical protein
MISNRTSLLRTLRPTASLGFPVQDGFELAPSALCDEGIVVADDSACRRSGKRERDQSGYPELSIGQVMEGQEDADSRRVMPIVPDWIPRTPLDYLLPHLSLLLLPLSTALSNPVNVWNR